MTTPLEADAKGIAVRDSIVQSIIDARTNSARSQQSKQRVLGMSDLGGCREYIRATIAGEPKAEKVRLAWPAEVGTAVGDHVEKILAADGWDTQETVTVTLPKTGVVVTGHLDEVSVDFDCIVDNKTVNGLADVIRDGPSFKNKVQISGYLLAAIQAKRLTTDGTGHLVYFDRSGADPLPYVWSTTYENALLILEAAENRLLDVQHALAQGSREARDGHLMTDEPESWCYAVQCPFYAACWAGYTPTGAIEHPRQIAAVQKYVEHRANAVTENKLKDAAREDLQGVEGIVASGPLEGTVVRWTISTTQTGRPTDRLDVREPK